MNVVTFPPRRSHREPVPFYIWLKHHHSPRIQRIAAIAWNKSEADEGGSAFLELTGLKEVYYIFCITEMAMQWVDGDAITKGLYR